MSKNLNKVMLTGNLGKDVDLSVTPSGKSVAKFSVACSNSRRTPDANGKTEDVQWFNVVAWEKLAETASTYLHKGSKIFIEGRLQSRSWDDKETGEKKYITEVIMTDMQFLDSKSSADTADEEETNDIPF